MPRPSIEFDWTLHIACNYRCPYCFFDGQWEELGRRKPPALNEIIKFWRSIYERYGHSHIILSGGESTVYPFFTELLTALSQWHTIKFPTNLWWPKQRWEHLAAVLDIKKLGIQASYHPTETELSTFLDKAEWMTKQGYDLYVLIVAYPLHIGKLDLWQEMIRNRGLALYVQPFQGKYGDRLYPIDYTETELDAVRRVNAGNSIHSSADDYRKGLEVAIGMRSPKGQLCAAGQLYCHIDEKGDIYRCNNLKPDGRIGNIRDQFSLYERPLSCPADQCLCESRWLVQRVQERS